MSPRLPGPVLVIGLGLLVGGCELLLPDPPVFRALMLDRESLPSHRHGETLERLERQFLERQAPGDRLIVTGLSHEDADGESSPTDGLPDITLDDRPLVATRSLRLINRRMAEGRDGREHEALTRIVDIAESLSNADETACLYIAFDPDRVAPPQPETTFSRRDSPAGNGWRTFLLIPASADLAHKRIGEWTHHLHHLGSSRIMISRLDQELPEC